LLFGFRTISLFRTPVRTLTRNFGSGGFGPAAYRVLCHVMTDSLGCAEMRSYQPADKSRSYRVAKRGNLTDTSRNPFITRRARHMHRCAATLRSRAPRGPSSACPPQRNRPTPRVTFHSSHAKVGKTVTVASSSIFCSIRKFAGNASDVLLTMRRGRRQRGGCRGDSRRARRPAARGVAAGEARRR